MKRVIFAAATAIAHFSIASSVCQAQMITTEERFQDLFVSAGYGAAFGAAFGAALLSFQKKPDQNLRYVAVGASIGFISGSLLGSYMIFSPMVGSHPESDDLSQWADKGASFRIRPSFDPNKKYQLNGIQGQWTLAQF